MKVEHHEDHSARTDYPERKSFDFEDAFIKAGHGLWQYLLLLHCGWANASDAIEILCISFIIPLIKNDMHVSYSALSALSITLFIGMLFGGYFWGSLADTYGRKHTICFSLTVNAAFGIFSGFSPNFSALLVFRFLSGFGAGGSLPVCFSYFSEFQQTNRRGAMISALAMCWMVGNLISGIMAWLILPESDTISQISPHGQQWRLFVILCALPSLLSAILFLFMPESPRFLNSSGQSAKAAVVLKTMFAWNHLGKHNTITHGVSKYYKSCEGDDEIAMLLQSNNEISECSSSTVETNFESKKSCTSLPIDLKRRVVILKMQICDIFAPTRRTHSIAIMFISIMVAFGGYGMAMWMPVLMERTERYDGSPCQAQVYNASSSMPSDISGLYMDVLIGFLGQIPGNVAVILLMDRVGAKYMLIVSSFLSGLSAFLFWLTTSKATVIAMNTIFNGITVGCWDAIDVLLVEMYPTNIRSAATGNATGASRLGSIAGTLIFGVFMDSSCTVPIITVFIAFVLSGIGGFKLPNSHKEALL